MKPSFKFNLSKFSLLYPIFFFSFVLCSRHSASQSLVNRWVKQIGGHHNELGGIITKDKKGNVYSSGTFQTTTDFDPDTGKTILTSKGLFDTYIQKLDPDGNLLWVKHLGCSSDHEAITSLVIDRNDNIYTTGYFEDTIDIDPGLNKLNFVSKRGYNMFIQKLSSNGDLIWAKQIEATNTVHGIGLTIDYNHDIYILGNFTDTVDFDPDTGKVIRIANQYQDIFLEKLDSNGKFIWVKQMGSSSNDYSRRIVTDKIGNVYTSGIFGGYGDFDPDTGKVILQSNGQRDVFLQKFDNQGKLLWAKSFGGDLEVWCSSIAIDINSNLLITGRFEGKADFDPGTSKKEISSKGKTDFYILKLDENGEFVWVNHHGGHSYDQSHKLILDDGGNVFICGLFSDTVDFDPDTSTLSLISKGETDMFIQKIDSNGKLLMIKQMGGIGKDNAGAIFLTKDSIMYITGAFQKTVDFSPNGNKTELTSLDLYDAFVQKLKLCEIAYGIDTQVVCDSLTWIDGITYTSNNDSAVYSIYEGASNGCDSVVTLNLTINGPVHAIDSQIACDSLTWIDGKTYTSNNNKAIYIYAGGAASGCDSIVKLDLTINKITDLTTSLNGNKITANTLLADSFQWLNCDSGMQIIPNEMDSVFIANKNGNYAVQISENGCVDTSDCVYINIVGIMENSFNDNIRVYPNPSSGKFTLEFENLHNEVSIRILNISGQLLESEIYKNTNLINFELHKPKGVYFLEVISENQMALIKLRIK